MSDKNKLTWYIGGLHFECLGCGWCCSGPEHGYIWVTGIEIARIADFLGVTAEQVRRKYFRRIRLRTTIVECHGTRDCIFLQKSGDKSTCLIYQVRPNQCRTWPFWPANLRKPNDWNIAARKCPGINRGRFYRPDEIDRIKKSKWYSTGNPQTLS